MPTLLTRPTPRPLVHFPKNGPLSPRAERSLASRRAVALRGRAATVDLADPGAGPAALVAVPEARAQRARLRLVRARQQADHHVRAGPAEGRAAGLLPHVLVRGAALHQVPAP